MMSRAVKRNPIGTQVKPLQSFVNGHDTYPQMPEQKLDILLSNSAAEDMMLMKSAATPNQQNSLNSSQTRMSSGRSIRASSGHRAPLLNGAGDNITQRTLTPTKQVSLVAVKRKNDRCKEMFSDDLDKGDRVTSHLSQTASSTSSPVSSGENDATSSVVLQKRQSKSKVTGRGKDGEDEEEESSEEEETVRKAPNQLLIEFVTTLMTDDYVTAKKLCEMILIYEPTNKEALQFQPLINEKIQLDEEKENEESDDETDSDDDSDDDDSDNSDSSASDQQQEPKAKQTGSEKPHCCNGTGAT